jgi:hypothetical protein
LEQKLFDPSLRRLGRESPADPLGQELFIPHRNRDGEPN